MAFTISDFDDLVKLLTQHPEWQARLRPVILGEEILQIPSRMDRVEAALERLTERIDALAQEQTRTSLQIATLVDRMDRMDGRLSNLEGGVLETRFAHNLPNWTRSWVRRGIRVYVDEVPALSDAVAAGKLTERDLDSLALADALVRGADTETGQETFLAVELSHTVRVDDVERADERASILKRAGLRVRPLVGGYRISSEAEELARLREVAVALWRMPA